MMASNQTNRLKLKGMLSFFLDFPMQAVFTPMFKMHFLKALFVCAAACQFSVTADAQTRTQRTPPTRQTEAQVSQPSGRTTANDVEASVAEALAIIEANHAGQKKLDYNSLFKSTIDSMLSSLDPHSNYLDAAEFDQFRTQQSSRYFGIGATIGDLTDPDGKLIGTYIKATFDGAPAHRAGLRYGDRILEVNGVSMAGKPFGEVRDNLRGPRGTSAKIVVERNSSGMRETVEIIRDAVPQPSIAESYMIRPDTGYIGMTGGFNQTTSAEFREAMQKLRSKGMKRLVIDLRNNGGGLVREAFFVANTFIPRGQTIFTQKGRLEGTTDTYRSSNNSPDNTPLVVLVNRGTASASEILAGALQDHDRALIVGESTFGKGLVQNPFPLEYGSMLLLTIAKYETPSGRLIQRDYSDGSIYSYLTKGGTLREETETRRGGDVRKTDAGRDVYTGGGIDPDQVVKQATLDDETVRNQVKLVNPIFAFSLELVAGRVKGFETLRNEKGIRFGHDLADSELSISPELFETFKGFAAERYKVAPEIVQKEGDFVRRTLRTELVTAAYGTTTSLQVFNEFDPQLQNALDLFPQAEQLTKTKAAANASAVVDR